MWGGFSKGTPGGRELGVQRLQTPRLDLTASLRACMEYSQGSRSGDHRDAWLQPELRIFPRFRSFLASRLILPERGSQQPPSSPSESLTTLHPEPADPAQTSVESWKPLPTTRTSVFSAQWELGIFHSLSAPLLFIFGRHRASSPRALGQLRSTYPPAQPSHAGSW